MKKLLLSYLVIQLFSFSVFAASPEIENINFARELEPKGYAKTTEFKSFEKINLFITLKNIKGKHTSRIEWYNPRGDLETFHSIETNKPFVHFWLKLAGEDPFVSFYRGFENEGEWKVKVYLDDKFVKEEKFKVEAVMPMPAKQ